MARAILLATLLLTAFSFAQESSENSTIVFYREVVHFTASFSKPSVYIDGKEVARLKAGRYFAQQVSPGKHELNSSMKVPLPVELKPGETIYVQMVMQPTNTRFKGRLIPVPVEDGKVALEKLKPVDKKE
jgi:hypothetical protein